MYKMTLQLWSNDLTAITVEVLISFDSLTLLSDT